MAILSAYLNNAICQLFDEIEEKCKVKFATFTASDLQGQQNIAAGKREYMDDTPNNLSHGIYKYLYDPELRFDFRFHQRLAAAPFQKTDVPWATLMFSTKQARPLTNILSHHYKGTYTANDGKLYELDIKRVNVPVDMALVSNDMTKLYNTAEKMAMYFDRFINFHYDHVINIGDPAKGGTMIQESKVGQAFNIKEVDLTKLDTERRGSLVAEAYSFDLVYFVVDTPGTSIQLLKKIILELEIKPGTQSFNIKYFSHFGSFD